MNSRIFGLSSVVVLAALIGSCKKDPTAPQAGGAKSVDFEFVYREVVVADSVRSWVVLHDALGDPVAGQIAVTSCNNAVAQVLPASDAPQLRTAFLIKGVTFGTACVQAVGAGITKQMQVATFPKAIVISSGPTTVVSGTATATYTYQFNDASGAAVAGVPAPTWSTSDTTRAIVDPATGVVRGRTAGTVDIVVKGVGGATAKVTASRTVLVTPQQFTGTILPAPLYPGQIIKIARGATDTVYDANTRAFGNAVGVDTLGKFFTADTLTFRVPDLQADGRHHLLIVNSGASQVSYGDVNAADSTVVIATPAATTGSTSPASGAPGTGVTLIRGAGDPVFDADTRAYLAVGNARPTVAGIRAFINKQTADTLQIVTPGVGVTGTVKVWLTRVGAADIAEQTGFNSTTTSLKDVNDPASDDSTTAPTITANGDYFGTVSGLCTNGFHVRQNDDCDDWFKVTNSGGSPATVTVSVQWFSPSASTRADLNLFLRLDDFSSCGAACTSNGTGDPATAAITIPAGATYYAHINYFNSQTFTSTPYRLRVSGLP